MEERAHTDSSDDELRRRVERDLETAADIDARRIIVSVVDGIVTLAGQVRSYSEKWEAERVVERLPHVRGIANEIEVHSDTTQTDSDLARRAIQALRRNMFVPADAIAVRVENGWVVLTGEVRRAFQRRAAERAVRNLPGVRGVTSQITIRPRAQVP